MEYRQYPDLAANDLEDGTVITNAKLPISSEGSSERSPIPLGIHREAALQRATDPLSHVRRNLWEVVVQYLAVISEDVTGQRAARRRRVGPFQIASCRSALDGS